MSLGCAEKYPPKECEECKSTFVTSNNLRRHRESMHSHSGSLPEFACLVTGCEAVFTNADLLVTHGLAHQMNGQGHVSIHRRCKFTHIYKALRLTHSSFFNSPSILSSMHIMKSVTIQEYHMLMGIWI